MEIWELEALVKALNSNLDDQNERLTRMVETLERMKDLMHQLLDDHKNKYN